MAGEAQHVITLAQADAAGEPAAVDGAADRPAETELHEQTGAEVHGGPPEIFPPFNVATYGSQLLWLALSFGALYLLMSRVALPRIGEILEIRRDRIEGDLAEAERLRQRTEQAIESYEQALAEARRKAHGIAEETRAGIRADLAEKRAAVEAELAGKMATAEARIQQTKTDALSNVEEIATDTATTLVSQILGRVPAKSIKDAVKAVAKDI
ncbi:MAG TPA: F0F1 ATP synthase subunit B [Devosiaceae bacterium]|nr:F0F1 ATP synthase subunit B [Devosiaceae bacterium]